jgi:glycine/D-amino acid oxidase-like deaminating enzyme
LRGGHSPWFAGLQHAPRQPLTEDITCDALIVGGGITGALMAEQLTRQGLDVVIVDRELPGRGSTVASTSMLLWEIDRSLQELTHLYGYERAARAYRASYDAVHGLKALVRTLNLRCDMRAKDSLYLAAGESAKGLIEEHALRARAGLPGTLLDHKTLLSEYDIARAGAIISPDSADSDPLQLALGLLNVATARGARLFEAETAAFDSAGHAVGVQLTDGHTIEARHVVLATGYVMPDIVHTMVQKALFKLGDRDEAAAGQTLARRRTDLGRQQGLSLRPNHRVLPHHHRRRRQRRDHRSRCTRCPDPCQGTCAEGEARITLATRRTCHRLSLGRHFRHHARWPAPDRTLCPAIRVSMPPMVMAGTASPSVTSQRN